MLLHLTLPLKFEKIITLECFGSFVSATRKFSITFNHTKLWDVRQKTKGPMHQVMASTWFTGKEICKQVHYKKCELQKNGMKEQQIK